MVFNDWLVVWNIWIILLFSLEFQSISIDELIFLEDHDFAQIFLLKAAAAWSSKLIHVGQAALTISLLHLKGNPMNIVHLDRQDLAMSEDAVDKQLLDGWETPNISVAGSLGIGNI